MVPRSGSLLEPGSRRSDRPGPSVCRMLQSEPVRAIASALWHWIAGHSMFMRRTVCRFRTARTLVNNLDYCVSPSLAFVWLGLNVIRFYTYPGDSDSGAVWPSLFNCDQEFSWKRLRCRLSSWLAKVADWATSNSVRHCQSSENSTIKVNVGKVSGRPCGDSVVPLQFPALSVPGYLYFVAARLVSGDLYVIAELPQRHSCFRRKIHGGKISAPEISGTRRPQSWRRCRSRADAKGNTPAGLPWQRPARSAGAVRCSPPRRR